jgi:hypothetical protein
MLVYGWKGVEEFEIGAVRKEGGEQSLLLIYKSELQFLIRYVSYFSFISDVFFSPFQKLLTNVYSTSTVFFFFFSGSNPENTRSYTASYYIT